jgi:hypothetical protein
LYVHFHDDGVCNCECTGPITIGEAPRKLSLYARVDIDTRGAELATVGEFLSRFCDAELLIPAAKASQEVLLSLKDVTLESVIQEAGLLVVNRG